MRRPEAAQGTDTRTSRFFLPIVMTAPFRIPYMGEIKHTGYHKRSSWESAD
jgi:hypothetical protein